MGQKVSSHYNIYLYPCYWKPTKTRWKNQDVKQDDMSNPGWQDGKASLYTAVTSVIELKQCLPADRNFILKYMTMDATNRTWFHWVKKSQELSYNCRTILSVNITAEPKDRLSYAAKTTYQRQIRVCQLRIFNRICRARLLWLSLHFLHVFIFLKSQCWKESTL